MALFKSSVIKLTFLFSLLISSSSALAGGAGSMTMTFGAGGAESIPSLSGMMLVVLSLLLFAIAFRTAKQKESNKFFVTLISSGAVLAALSGASDFKTNFEAHAGVSVPPPPSLTIDFDRDNTLRPIIDGLSTYSNIDPELTGTITDITISSFCTSNATANQCTELQTLAPGASCDLNITCGSIIPPISTW